MLPRRLRLYRCCCRVFKSRFVVAVVITLNMIFIVCLYRGPGQNPSSSADPQLADVTIVAGDTEDLDVEDNSGTPLLDRLDTVRIRRQVDVSITGAGLLEQCDVWTAGIPDIDMEEPMRWQIVVAGVPDTYVFSAYYDPRTLPGAVKIIGISSGISFAAADGITSKPVKYCQLWFDGEAVPRTTLAEYVIVPETHDRKYAASFHVCYLQSNVEMPPYAVSLVTERCQSPNNVLKVLNNEARLPADVDFTVCVTPLNLHFDNVHRFIEFIEVHRLFGADRFIFYNHSMGHHVTAHLRGYVADGVVSALVPWRIPVAVDVWPPDPKEEPEIHYFGQLAALNDCLYRSMFRSRFVVLVDLDEAVVPRRRERWRPMLEDATARWRRRFFSADGTRTVDDVFPGAYLVQNVFFRTNWPDDDLALNDTDVRRFDLLSLRKTRREDRPYPFYSRSKYIAWTRAVSMLGVHNVMEFLDDFRVLHVLVDGADTLLHHYRIWDGDSFGLGSNVPLTDRRMSDFGADLVARVAARHRRRVVRARQDVAVHLDT